MRLLLVFPFILLQFLCFSQIPLFETIDDESIICSSEEQPKITALNEDSRYLEVYPVSLNPLSEAVFNYTLIVKLPHLNDKVQLPIKNIDYISESDYTLDGASAPIGGPGPGPDPDPCDGLQFSFLFSMNAHGLCGYIQYEDVAYQVVKICENQYYLLKDDQTQYLDCGDHNNYDSVNDEEVDISARSSSNSISLLVLYTHEAEQDINGNIRSRIDADIAQMELILRNTELGDFCVNVLAVKKLTNSGLTSEVDQEAVTFLRNDPAVIALRESFGADLVTVYLGDNNLPTVFGFSSLNSFSNPNQGYLGVVRASGSQIRRPFTHETFHNVGCKHNDDNSSVSNSYARAAQVSGNTVMIRSGNVGLDDFSNPLTGTGESDRDNARQILDAAAQIGNFKDENVSVFRAVIYAPHTSSNSSNINFTVSTEDCIGTSEVLQITFSADGINFASIPQSYIQGNQVVGFPMPDNRHLTIRTVMACTFNGVTEYDTETTKINNSDYDPCKPTTTVGYTPISEVGILSISPNPIKESQITVDYYLSKEMKVKVSLSDLNGKALQEEHTSGQKGENSFKFNVHSSFEGTAVLTLTTTNGLASKKIVRHE